VTFRYKHLERSGQSSNATVDLAIGKVDQRKKESDQKLGKSKQTLSRIVDNQALKTVGGDSDRR
jgi:hypothetical protein